ncbi:hypothetical protein RSOLAG1IB_12673 [Rhizoctonia solani AG-1 IB]|uniref:Uncharacterized protein n=1 Tax=Thanatephorus cucumeris (strain AG1-IB / isolate 7/3/14) TaxID=1108050 RepID=A0A0B7FZW8_THACB|nr:hypothetical protein RSOLAG1IB_12673 [Rhizoctonia solani AG-1 IB]
MSCRWKSGFWNRAIDALVTLYMLGESRLKRPNVEFETPSACKLRNKTVDPRQLSIRHDNNCTIMGLVFCLLRKANHGITSTPT